LGDFLDRGHETALVKWSWDVICEKYTAPSQIDHRWCEDFLAQEKFTLESSSFRNVLPAKTIKALNRISSAKNSRSLMEVSELTLQTRFEDFEVTALPSMSIQLVSLGVEEDFWASIVITARPWP
jgi:hypothetical protein